MEAEVKALWILYVDVATKWGQATPFFIERLLDLKEMFQKFYMNFSDILLASLS